MDESVCTCDPQVGCTPMRVLVTRVCHVKSLCAHLCMCVLVCVLLAWCAGGCDLAPAPLQSFPWVSGSLCPWVPCLISWVPRSSQSPLVARAVSQGLPVTVGSTARSLQGGLLCGQKGWIPGGNQNSSDSPGTRVSVGQESHGHHSEGGVVGRWGQQQSPGPPLRSGRCS